MNSSTWNIALWIENTNNAWGLIIIGFFVSQLVNVILSTIKSVVLIKESPKESPEL